VIVKRTARKFWYRNNGEVVRIWTTAVATLQEVLVCLGYVSFVRGACLLTRARILEL